MSGQEKPNPPKKLKKEEELVKREEALKTQFEPQKLDEMLAVVSPRTTAFMIILGSLLVLIMVWLCFGTIFVRVEGKGILLNQAGLINVVSNVGGVVDKIFVNSGSVVKEGQLICRLNDSRLEAKYQKLKTEVELQAKQLTILKNERGAQGNSSHSTGEIDISDKEVKLVALQKNLDDLHEQVRALDIKSPSDGYVLEVLIRYKDIIKQGTPILWMERYENGVRKLQVAGYFPAAKGKQIRAGEQAQIELESVDSQQFGYMMGKILAVSEYPASKEQMMKIIGNNKIVEYLQGLEHSEPVIQVIIELTQNKDGSYRWTSNKNPPIPVTSGTFCKITTVVEEIRPLYYFFPIESWKQSVWEGKPAT